MKFITQYWYQPELEPPVFLKILSRVFSSISHQRRQSFLNKETEYKAPVPVIVIGNISVGGTGKTPLLIALIRHFQQKNIKIGVISRGYGGKSKQWPAEVTIKSKADVVGDEPLLIAQQTQCPMFVGADRNADIKALLTKYPNTQVILSDDGMQHYKMHRDIEIAVIDGQRRFGNKRLLPAGPLREPVSRLDSVDIQVINGGNTDEANDNTFLMQLEGTRAYRLSDNTQTRPLSDFAGKKVRAVAGIGNPQRFFDMLTSLNIIVLPHAYDDHYQYKKSDFNFEPLTKKSLPLLMTEKDAVKCKTFEIENGWVVPVSATLNSQFYDKIIDLFNENRRLISGSNLDKNLDNNSTPNSEKTGKKNG